MIIIYFLIGIAASVLGALPLGASNIAVINTILKQNNNTNKIQFFGYISFFLFYFLIVQVNLFHIYNKFVHRHIGGGGARDRAARVVAVREI